MKALLTFISLLPLLFATTQNNASDFKTIILALEAKRINSLYNESTTRNGAMLIAKQVSKYDIAPGSKDLGIFPNAITADEAIEIFGKDNDLFDFKNSAIESWTKEDFPGISVDIFDFMDKSPERRILTVSKLITAFSEPILRNDGKYAIIEVTNEHEGIYFSVYKKVDSAWLHFKTFQLALI